MIDEDYQKIKKVIDYIINRHPTSYGILNGKVVYEPGDNSQIIERYSRCPNCEVWTPPLCGPRQIAEDAMAVLILMRERGNV